VLNGKTVCIPAEAALDIVAFHGPVSWDDILDGRSEKMAVMGQTGCERGAIVESVVWLALG